jgi:hypothetical protein
MNNKDELLEQWRKTFKSFNELGEHLDKLSMMVDCYADGNTDETADEWNNRNRIS